MADEIKDSGKSLDTSLILEYPEYIKDSLFEKGLTPNKRFALEKKYLVRDDDGIIIETPAQAIYRISKTIGDVEKQYGKSDEEAQKYTKEFYDMMDNAWFSPAGRIWTNAGTHIKGLFNCYVLPIEDDLEQIFESVKKAAIIHKNGGGTGYNFSAIRPRGTYVQKSKGIASGLVSFITQFDRETEIINSGNRRGANMGIANINHPDILDFIYAKAARGEITNFNVSVGMFDSFMEAVEKNDFYTLKFEDKPFTAEQLKNIVRNIEENKLGGSDVGKAPKPASLKLDIEKDAPIVYGKTNVIDSYSGKVAGRVNDQGHIQLFAPYIMDVIANLAWKTADPGIIFLDAVNRNNPLLETEGPTTATNPCGEQPLHPYDACDLGSIIMKNMLKYDKIDGVTPEKAGMKPEEVTKIVSGKRKLVKYRPLEGMLNDNSNLNYLMDSTTDNLDTRPEEYSRIVSGKKVSIDYDRIDETVRRAMRFLDNVNDANKGPIPEVEKTVLNHRRVGLGIMGWADMLMELGMKYDSEEAYELAEEVMSFISNRAKKYSVELAKEKGVFPAFVGSSYDNGNLENRVRNLQRTTIAPTGTISMVYDVASGIEPFYALTYKKNIRGGDAVYYSLPAFAKVIEERGLNLKEIEPLIADNYGSAQGIDKIPKEIQDMFRTAHDMDYKGHILAQAAFQRGLDNAVSKTINMRGDVKVDDIKQAYIFSWKNNNKGVTVYRDGSKDVQVLEIAKKNENINNFVATPDNPLNVPDIMPAMKISQNTPDGKMHTFIVYDPKDGRGLETFLTLGNAGTSQQAEVESLGRLGSLVLRIGGKIKNLINQVYYIGSGDKFVKTRSGDITSIPQGFGVTLKKYEIATEKYNVNDIASGKYDYKKLSEEVSDMIRTGNGNGGEDHSLTETDVKEEKRSAPTKKGDCPECGEGTIIKVEGCEKCSNPGCSYSKC